MGQNRSPALTSNFPSHASSTSQEANVRHKCCLYCQGRRGKKQVEDKIDWILLFPDLPKNILVFYIFSYILEYFTRISNSSYKPYGRRFGYGILHLRWDPCRLVPRLATIPPEGFVHRALKTEVK